MHRSPWLGWSVSRFFASSARVDPFSVSATIVSVSRVRASCTSRRAAFAWAETSRSSEVAPRRQLSQVPLHICLVKCSLKWPSSILRRHSSSSSAYPIICIRLCRCPAFVASSPSPRSIIASIFPLSPHV